MAEQARLAITKFPASLVGGITKKRAPTKRKVKCVCNPLSMDGFLQANQVGSVRIANKNNTSGIAAQKR